MSPSLFCGPDEDVHLSSSRAAAARLPRCLRPPRPPTSRTVCAARRRRRGIEGLPAADLGHHLLDRPLPRWQYDSQAPKKSARKACVREGEGREKRYGRITGRVDSLTMPAQRMIVPRPPGSRAEKTCSLGVNNVPSYIPSADSSADVISPALTRLQRVRDSTCFIGFL